MVGGKVKGRSARREPQRGRPGGVVEAQKYRIPARQAAPPAGYIFVWKINPAAGWLLRPGCRTSAGPANGRLVTSKLGHNDLYMTNEELKQDFDSARIKHVHFKSKLRSFLFSNGGAEAPLRDPEQCGLGRWIADRLRAPGPYAHLPEARQLDRQHVLIHQEANRLMDMHQAGHIDEAMAGFAPMQVIADEIAVLFQKMEQQLRTKK